MFNDKLDTWQLINMSSLPEFDQPIFILVEHDVVGNGDHDDYPFSRKAQLVKANDPVIFGGARVKLLDYDPETEEEFLHQCYTVIAWRYV